MTDDSPLMPEERAIIRRIVGAAKRYLDAPNQDALDLAKADYVAELKALGVSRKWWKSCVK